MNYDVLIIGAGTAGATAAWKCAENGLNVLVIDHRKRPNVGASWVNGVETRLFSDLGFGDPEPPVLFHKTPAFHMVSPGGFRVTATNAPVLEIDMLALNRDLLDRAESCGATFRFKTKCTEPIFDKHRVAGVRTKASRGTEQACEAAVTIDAGGMAGVLRSRLPRSMWRSETFLETDVCVAAQQVRDISDESAARRFISTNDIEGGETICWSSVRGGYSILNVNVDPAHGKIAILTGAMRSSQGPQAAVELMQEAIVTTGCSKKKEFGGGGLIPVRRAFDQLVGNGYALLGDAASQVFPAHGSGVAAGMRAAEILSRTIVRALSAGMADTAALWPYAAEYQRTRGALCASHEWVRRLTESMTASQVDTMFQTGLLDGRATARTVACLPLRLSSNQLVSAARAMVSAPRTTKSILTCAYRAARTQLHYQRYPATYDARQFQAWCDATRRLFSASF